MGDVTEGARVAGPPAVAVAIVTSDLGVLVGRRRDGNPPWTFPGGKVEAGESPEDAAVRETLEETGQRIRATRVIGIRVHPLTGVLIVYVAAAPAGEADPVTASRDELDEVRWITAARGRGADARHVRCCSRLLAAGHRLNSRTAVDR
jgi:8-oxo-dGTP pyrophosphatase MutT (NUDIX family)